MAGRDLLSSIWRADLPPALAPRDWEDMLAQARAARLVARLAALYRDRGWLAIDSAVPAAPRHHLQSALRFAERLRHEVLFETDMIAVALRDVPTPVVLLKGAAYVAAGLPPGCERLFSDVDILVRRDQLAAVEAALMAAGWIADKLDPYDDRYYRQYMHELPPLKHVRRDTLLDVHHTVAPPTSRFRIDGAALLARARPIPDAPGGLAMLDPADMVLHSVLHMMQEGQFSGGLRDLLDIDDLLRHFGNADSGFWTELLRRAGDIGTGVALVHALTQIERLFGPCVPAALRPALQALAPPVPQRRLMARLLAVALRPDHPSADSAGSGLCRWLLYVRSHWLRMPWYQIGPHLARKWVTRCWASLQRLSSSSRTKRTGMA